MNSLEFTAFTNSHGGSGHIVPLGAIHVLPQTARQWRGAGANPHHKAHNATVQTSEMGKGFLRNDTRSVPCYSLHQQLS